MDWARVAQHLDEDAKATRDRAAAAFPNDFQAQREMLTRAAILQSLAEALRAGLQTA